MNVRVRIDTLPQPAVTEGLIGHRFELSGGVESHTDSKGREYTMDTTRLADEAAAAEFVRKLTGSHRVEFTVLGITAPADGLVFDRRVVVVDHEGFVVNSFIG